jgi:hypothetical protein
LHGIFRVLKYLEEISFLLDGIIMKIFRGKFDLLEIALLDGFSVNDDENI